MDNVKTASVNEVNNLLIEEALSSSEVKEDKKFKVTAPSDTLVTLPAGFIGPDGEVIKTVEVRELNGFDEEAISKSGTPGKALGTIINRATVKIGALDATEDNLDRLLAGDRDMVLLGIFKATFGSVAEIPGFCAKCNDFKTAQVDLDKDVEVKGLLDPVEDRTFKVQGKTREYLVTLPNGRAQREISTGEDKTGPELTTILLNNTVLEIDGQPVLGKTQLQGLSMPDRRAISDAISERLPGPQFEDMVLPCPDCDGEVVVPFSLGALFRF
jgi:hypothetical protein